MEIDIKFIDPKDLEQDVIATIDFLRKERKLSPHTCLAVLQILIQNFPKEYVVVLK